MTAKKRKEREKERKKETGKKRIRERKVEKINNKGSKYVHNHIENIFSKYGLLFSGHVAMC